MSDRRAELTPNLLLNAYAAGVFPMADSADDPEVFWVDPALRGVLPLDSFHIPKSLRKRLKRRDFSVTVDCAFPHVLSGCAARDETWINQKIRDLYIQLHDFGYGHSVEVWMEGRLVGGLYGVTLGGAYFGESMFSHEPEASKIALVFLMARLKHGGFKLVDTQFVTEHLRRFGAREISRKQYHRELNAALDLDADYSLLPADASLEDVMQLATQKS